MSDKTLEILVGIDFGTTNSVISKFKNNKTIILNDGISKLIPTKIGVHNDKFYCGNHIPIDCKNIISNFKLDISNEKIICLDTKSLTINDLLILFFKHLYYIISKNHNLIDLIIKCVITVPSNFNDIQRKIIKSSLEYNNFIVLRIINEPSAAAIAYGLNYSSNIEEEILVIDIGGGTTDFTVLQKTDLFFEVKHSEGLNLGGNNLTDYIFNDIISKTHFDIINKNAIWLDAQNIKEKLSYLDYYEIILHDFKYTISISYYELLIQDFINKLKAIINNIISIYPNINYTILVGGTNKIPLIQTTCKELLKNKIWIYPNLEFAVVEGAGIYAGIIENKFMNIDDIVLLDVLPISLGVELADGTYSIIIPKNTPLPTKKNQKYTTNSPNEKNINIKFYQGEKKIANKNTLIGEIMFGKLSIGGVPIIDIEFKVDLNSIISINIIDKKSGDKESLIIENKQNIKNDITCDNNICNELDDEDIIKLQTIYQIKTTIENCLHNIQSNNLISIEEKDNIINKFMDIESKINIKNNLELKNILQMLHENYDLMNTLNYIDETNYLNVNDSNELENKYKKDLYNLCLYLKSEIHEINLDQNKISKLKTLIETTLSLFNVQNVNWKEELDLFNKICEDIYNI
jgi:molecular chaperone DnaK